MSCVIFDRAGQKRPSTVLAVVKQQSPDTFPNYMVNFGLGYEPTATLNFSEVLRLGRLHMDRVFPDIRRQFNPV